MNKTMKNMLVVAGLLAGQAHADVVVDARSQSYQLGTEHLARAHEALRVAVKNLKTAEAYYDFPGLDTTKMIGLIQDSQETMGLILSPEKKRLQYKTLVPDGVFLRATPIKNLQQQ